MGEIKGMLKRYWGTDFSLRSQQPEIVQALTNKQDVLALLPTGEGKSLCYQLAGLVLGGITLVISPLIALMQDQVQGLKTRGIPVVHLHGRLTRHERERLLFDCVHTGGFVYLSPEQLQGSQLRAFFWQHAPKLVVIDEAHCISQWGHDFRPAYRRIPDFIEHLQIRPVLGAFTATAPKHVAEDIRQLLQLRQPFQVRGIPIQPHIHLQIQRCWTPRGRWQILKNSLRDKTLIYAATRQETEDLAEHLQTNLNRRVLFYHAGCNERKREQTLEIFARQPKVLMVATKAFGMGVDIGDIQRVIHWNLPESLSAYVQEVGRAGRNRQGEASGLLLQLWGEKAPVEQFSQPLRADQIRAVIKQLLHEECTIQSLRKRFQLPDSALHQIFLPLQMAGVLLCEGELCRLKAEDAKQLYQWVWQSAKALQKSKDNNLKELRKYIRSGSCRRKYLYTAFSLPPEEDCGSCDRCCKNQSTSTTSGSI